MIYSLEPIQIGQGAVADCGWQNPLKGLCHKQLYGTHLGDSGSNLSESHGISGAFLYKQLSDYHILLRVCFKFR